MSPTVRRYVVRLSWYAIALASIISLWLLSDVFAKGTGGGFDSIGITIAVIIGILGNFVHLVKVTLKGESDQSIIAYLGSHKFVFVVGLLVTVFTVLVASQTILASGGLIDYVAAFLAGFTADSFLGKYTSDATRRARQARGATMFGQIENQKKERR